MSSCPSCGREVLAHAFPGGSVQCACGAILQVPELPKERPATLSAVPTDVPSAHPCPRCHAPLDSRETEGYFVEVCPTDHGVFVAHDVLASMRAEGPAAVAELDTVVRAPEVEAHYIHCPRCHEPMARRAFARGSGIVVDVCAAHGTWFDAGEIHDALAFQVKSGQPAPSDLVNIPAQAKATLDVALAFEAERDASEVKEMTRDLTRTFTHVILGGRTPF